MRSYSRPVERCRPLLGTFVRIRVEGLSPERAHAAIDAAFDEISQIHCLMSFHEAGSDVARLNRIAHAEPVQIDGRTYEVLARAADLASLSDGAFDISIAPALVKRGLLPAPPGAPKPDMTANWSDIALLENRRVRFSKPLWIDLGGIAKGYAVDRAVAVLECFLPAEICVNAGGDLRLTGRERVRLAPGYRTRETAVVDLECGSLASSCGTIAPAACREADGPHVHARTLRSRNSLPAQFVCVVANRCIDADALTKVVMAEPSACAAILAHYSARALMHDAQFGWREIGRPG